MTSIDSSPHVGRLQAKKRPNWPKELAHQLVDNHLVGVRIPNWTNRSTNTWPKHRGDSIQNYAILDVTKDAWEANYVFIHGRELFTPKHAERFFTPHYDHANTPSEAFKDEAKDKLRKWFTPQTYATRRKYCNYDPSGAKENVERMVQGARHKYPALKIRSLPPLTPAHDTEIVDALNEAYNAEPFRKQEAQKIIAEFDRTSLPNVRKHAHTLMPKVWDVLKQYEYDPQVLRNFLSGIRIAPQSEDSIAAIIDMGLEERIRTTLIRMAETMSNPYDPRFLEAEQTIAQRTSESVHPRVLRMGIRNKTVLIHTTDRKCPEPELLEEPNLCGRYQRPYARSPYQTDFVIVREHDDPAEEKRTFRHEYEHMADYCAPRQFAELHTADANDMFRQDNNNVEQYLIWLDAHIHDPSAYTQKLIAKIEAALRPELRETLPDDVKKRAEMLKKFVDDIDSHMDGFAKAHLGITCEHYDTHRKRVNEVAPVIEELNMEYGKAFVNLILPNMSKAVSQYRYTNMHLRDNPEAAAHPAR
jgi:hypothetical protein